MFILRLNNYNVSIGLDYTPLHVSSTTPYNTVADGLLATHMQWLRCFLSNISYCRGFPHSSNPNRTPKYMRDSQFHTLTQATHSLFFLFHSMFMKKYENKDCLEQFLWYLENGEIESFIFQCIYVWSFSLEIFQNHFNGEYSSIKGNSSEPNSQYLGVIRGPLLRLNTGRSGKENGSIKASHRINIESCSQYAISHTTI